MKHQNKNFSEVIKEIIDQQNIADAEIFKNTKEESTYIFETILKSIYSSKNTADIIQPLQALSIFIQRNEAYKSDFVLLLDASKKILKLFSDKFLLETNKYNIRILDNEDVILHQCTILISSLKYQVSKTNNLDFLETKESIQKINQLYMDKSNRFDHDIEPYISIITEETISQFIEPNKQINLDKFLEFIESKIFEPITYYMMPRLYPYDIYDEKYIPELTKLWILRTIIGSIPKDLDENNVKIICDYFYNYKIDSLYKDEVKLNLIFKVNYLYPSPICYSDNDKIIEYFFKKYKQHSSQNDIDPIELIIQNISIVFGEKSSEHFAFLNVDKFRVMLKEYFKAKALENGNLSNETLKLLYGFKSDADIENSIFKKTYGILHKRIKQEKLDQFVEKLLINVVEEFQETYKQQYFNQAVAPQQSTNNIPENSQNIYFTTDEQILTIENQIKQPKYLMTNDDRLSLANQIKKSKFKIYNITYFDIEKLVENSIANDNELKKIVKEEFNKLRLEAINYQKYSLGIFFTDLGMLALIIMYNKKYKEIVDKKTFEFIIPSIRKFLYSKKHVNSFLGISIIICTCALFFISKHLDKYSNLSEYASKEIQKRSNDRVRTI